jgi:hypothetical protein
LGTTVVSSAPVLDLAVSILPTCSNLDVGGPVPVASSSVRPASGGHPLSSSSKASSGLLELGAG